MANKIFSKLDRAVQKAYDRQNKIFGFQSDPALARYEHMQPIDFETIRDNYGEDGLVSYVSAMEAKRMKGDR